MSNYQRLMTSQGKNKGMSLNYIVRNKKCTISTCRKQTEHWCKEMEKKESRLCSEIIDGGMKAVEQSIKYSCLKNSLNKDI